MKEGLDFDDDRRGLGVDFGHVWRRLDLDSPSIVTSWDTGPTSPVKIVDSDNGVWNEAHGRVIKWGGEPVAYTTLNKAKKDIKLRLL